MDDLIAQLNEDQRQAVLHAEGPAMVMAGAGSGKTRVLTTRVAWLLQTQNLQPEEILLVTFTNKAAQEMNHRVERQAGVRLPLAGTFHRIAARILRQYGQHIGLSPDYTIYDSDDQLSLIKQIYKAQGLDSKEFNPKAVKGAISEAKNEMLTSEQYEQFAQGRFQTFVARVYKLYQHELRKQQAMDFDDLLLRLHELLVGHKEILGHFQEQIKHVLVDEYQDTNKVQYELTKLFARPQDNLYVVGDFAQSIYAWRGADYRNMLHLKQDFVHLTEYKLEQNYRSTQSILDAATNVISQNTNHPILELWTTNTVKDKLTVLETATGDEEAQAIVKEIDKLHRDYSYEKMVILYRTNAQSRPFEEVFVRQGIPYRIVGGFKFYERKEIKDLLAYLRVTINPQDTVSHERIIKLGKRRAATFEAWLAEPVGEGMTPPAQLPPGELLKTIIAKTNYLDLFDDKDPEDAARIENVEELVNVASQFDHTATFLENVALVQDDALADVDSPDLQASRVTLMSLHSAKGLEYPVVFMVGMEDGLLPHSRALLDKEQMEEERRLCYVGITRAQEKLYFSYARRRWVYGASQYSLRSRFLGEIEPDLLKVVSSVSNLSDNPYSLPASQRGSSFGQNQWQPPKPHKPTRHIVADDVDLDAILSGEMDLKTFLRN